MSSKKPNDFSPCTTNEKRPRTRQTELALLNTFVPAFVSLTVTWPTLLFEFRTDVREHDSRANRMKWHPTKVNYFCTHQCESSENNQKKDAALVTGLSTATHNKTSRNKERNKTNAWLWIKAKKPPQKNEFLSFGRLLNTNAIVFTR